MASIGGCDSTCMVDVIKVTCFDKPTMSVTPPVWWMLYKVTCFDLPTMSVTPPYGVCDTK